MDFESSFAGVRKTVDGVVDKGGNLTAFGKQLQGDFRNLAKEIPISVNELNRIGESAGQLGIKSESILGFTKTIAAMGIATNLSAEQAADGMARFANITQMPQEKIGNLGSVIVELGNKLAATESEILEFGLRIAGAGEIVGMTEAQILGIGAAFASVGVEAEAGGTAVQKALLSMNSAVNTGKGLGDFGKAIGGSGADFAALFQSDPGEALAKFIEGVGAAGKGGEQVLRGVGIDDARQIRAFLSMASAGDLFRNSLKMAGDEWIRNTALAKEAEQRYRTFESQLTLFKNRVNDIAITLGTRLIDAFLKMEPAISTVLNAVAGMVEIFASLPTPVQTAAMALTGVAAAIGPLTYLVGTFMTTGAALMGFFRSLPAVVSVSSGAIGLTGAGFGAALVALGAVGAVAVYKVVGAIRDLWNVIQSGESIWEFFTAKDDDNFVRRWLGLSSGIRETADAMRDLKASLPASPLLKTALPTAAMSPEAAEALMAGSASGGGSLAAPAAMGAIASKANEAADSIKRFRSEWADFKTEQIRDFAALKAGGKAFFGEEVGKAGDPGFDYFGAQINQAFDALGGVNVRSAFTQQKEQDKFFAAQASISEAMPDPFAGVNIGSKFIYDFGETVRTKLGPTILSAFTGGGNVGQSIGAFLGGSLTEGLAGKLTGSLSGMFGKTIGGALGSVIPGLGTMLGSMIGPMIGKLAGKIWGGIQSIFGNDEEARDVNPARDAFLAEFGGGGTGEGSGFHNLAAQLTGAGAGEGGGALFQALTQADTMTEFNAAVSAVQTKLAEARTSVADVTSANETFNMSLTGSDEAIAKLGETQLTVTEMMLQGFDSLLVKLDEMIARIGMASGAWTALDAQAAAGMADPMLLAAPPGMPTFDPATGEAYADGVAGGPSVTIQAGTIVGNPDELAMMVAESIEGGGDPYNYFRQLTTQMVTG